MIETYYHLTMHTLNYDSCTEARRARQLRDAELAEERRREQKDGESSSRARQGGCAAPKVRRRNPSGEP